MINKRAEFLRLSREHSELDPLVRGPPRGGGAGADPAITQGSRDDKTAILAIRAGTGSDEAALFAGDLYRMYSRFAERHGWKLEVMSLSEGTSGGFKEVIP